METLGFVVNPIAGMGGRVGLKGTDGQVDEARRRGAEPRAPDRAIESLETLARRAPETEIVTAAGPLGADAARAAGFDPEVVYAPSSMGDEQSEIPETDASDTKAAVRGFLEYGVDLVLFVGGDGTAVDVAEVLTEAGDGDTPMLGVPAGVKIYSSVFGVTPADAGRVVAEFDRIEDREVNDIDEEAYRQGEVRAELRAVVPVPVSSGVQSSKQLSSGSVETLAEGFAAEIDEGTTYVFAPGSTVGAIQSALGMDPSPLGVDVWRDGEVLARDASEDEILAVLEEPTVIVVSPIGGQGFVFGRGNHQISPAVIERAADIEIVASEDKLDAIGQLRVDTDDEAVDESLRGWTQVRTGRFTTRLLKLV